MAVTDNTWLAALSLAAILLAVFWQLRRYGLRQARAGEQLRRLHEGQLVLNRLLKLPVEQLSLEALLHRCLEELSGMPWLAVQRRGGLFIADRDDAVSLKASVNMPEAVLKECAIVAHNYCLCGRAAASGEIVHADSIDERHEVRYPGMPPHGHYCVPLKFEGKTIGVLALYLRHGHRYNDYEAAFLESLGNTLATLIERKRRGEDLRLADTVFEHYAQGVLITDAQANILRVNRAFTDITGYGAAEVLGRNPRLLKSGRQDAAFYRWMWSALLGAGEWEGEIWNRRRNGEFYPQWLAIRAIRNERGETSRYLGIFADISERKQSEERVHQLAYYDVLTGLANRTLFLDHLKVTLAQAGREKRGVALLFLDLDHFKAINDSMGHTGGDRLLQETARRLGECLREGDIAARLGGDEFVICLPAVGGESKDAGAAAATVAKKIRASLLQPYTIDEREVTVTPSLGIALYPWDADNANDLVKNADTAMYLAKSAGRNNFQFFVAADPRPG